MKRFISISLLILIALPAFCQEDNLIYSFKTKHHKRVELLFNENDSVFICRFYSLGRLKFEVRDTLTDADTVFTVHGYHRGGGVENAAMDYNDVTFSNDAYDYDIYFVWAVNEEDPESDNPPIYGIKIYKDGEEISDFRGTKVLEGDVYGWSFYDILPEEREE
jgi:hypothetical protein